MTNLTPELNLVQAEDDDDIADYNVISLADSLAILDGMFHAGTGHAHNGAHQGGTLGPNAFADNTIPGAKLVDNSVHGTKLVDASVAGGKLAPNLLETLYTGSLIVAPGNYTVPIASNVMYVWCSTTMTITLTAGIQRPISIRCYGGQVTVVSTSGVVAGGSVDIATGTILNGRVNNGDTLTYKWDGSNWGAV